MTTSPAHSRPVGSLLALWILASAQLSACSAPAAAPDAPRGDAPRGDAPLGDASLAGCAPLELGLCVRSPSGLPCTGAPDEDGAFVAPGTDTVAQLVLGPQGSRMLVLAARTRGIEPGDPARPSSSSNPVIEMIATDDAGHELTSYRGRAAFVPDPADPTLFVQPEIFVIMEGALPPRVRVLGTLRDRLGAERCGALSLAME